MIAYTVHKQVLCSKCGYPREVCRDKGAFIAQKEVCHASAVVESAQEESRKAGSDDHGVIWLPQLTETMGQTGAAKPPPGMFD